ncbi:hypothetical protein PG989_002282 [Apiospora arundinis]
MNGQSSFQKREPINGFPRFADAITQDPDRTGTIYRRFDRLASRDLLLMEAEIAELEALQDRYDEDDCSRHDLATCESHSKCEQRFDDGDDLVALKVLANQDRLSQFVLNHCGWLFRERQSHGTSVVISERSVDKATTVLSSILSAMVLFGSIVSLYFVQNPYALLGMVGGWTILFAVCVGVLTNAKRDQIFAATAAFAAVLVVFVGESLDKGRGGSEGSTGNCTCTPA